MSRDLKIADWEYLYAEQMLNVYIDHLKVAAVNFQEVMATIGSCAIVDGKDGIGDQCIKYHDRINATVMQLSDLRGKLTGAAQRFVEAVDEADQFIYGAG